MMHGLKLILSPLFIIALMAVPCAPEGSTSANAASNLNSMKAVSLCTKGERVVWSCETVRERKIASLCGSKVLDSERGYLQYRFGRPGRIELEFPKGRTDTQSAFRYSRYTRPLVTYLKVEFFNNSVAYTISDDSNDEEKPAQRYAAITVKHSDGNAKETTLRCRQPITGSLMKLEDVVQRKDYDQ